MSRWFDSGGRSSSAMVTTLMPARSANVFNVTSKKGDIENGHLVHTFFILTQVPENLVRILEFGPPATFYAAQFRNRFSQGCVL